MAADRYEIGRKLAEVERVLAEIDPPPRPEQIVIVRFTDDSPEALQEYTDQLWERFPKSLVVTIAALAPRPPGFKAPWTSPRAWLDYEPEPHEAAFLRPSFNRSSIPPVEGAPPPAADLDVGPGAEHRERIARAAVRWREQARRDGTTLLPVSQAATSEPDAGRGVPGTPPGNCSSAGLPAEAPHSTSDPEASPAPPQLPPDAGLLRFNGPRRRGLEELGPFAGPLGSKSEP